MRKLVSGLGLLVVLVWGVACTRVISYEVQPGDTLLTIAAKFGTTTADIARENLDKYPNLTKNPLSLQPGIVLKVRVPANAAEVFQDVVTEVRAKLADNNPTPTPVASPPVASPPVSDQSKAETTAANIMQLTNTARSQNRLGNLASDSTLERIALTRSQDMIARNYFSHDDPATRHVAFEDLIKAYRFPFQFAGENIAEIRNDGPIFPAILSVFRRYTAYELAQQFTTGWLNSPEHRDNLLNGRFHRTGISVALNSDGTRVVATQVFSD